MSIKDDLIQDIRVGMHVTITKADGATITGETLKIDHSSIKVKTERSIYNILVSAIESYEIPIMPEEIIETDDGFEEEPLIFQEDEETEEDFSKNLDEKAPEIFIGEINYCISMLTSDNSLYSPTLNGIKNSEYNDENLSKAKILGIISLWERAMAEENPVKKEKKCNAVIQGVTQLYNETKHFVASEIIARMNFEINKFEDAANWFQLCGNSAAVYVSLFRAGSEKRFEHINEYIINSRRIDSVLLYDILLYIKKNSLESEFASLAEVMEFDEESDKLQLIFCGMLYLVSADSKYIKWANVTDLYTESNYKLLIELMKIGAPVSVKSEVSRDIYKGIIISFDKERRYGFISDTPSNTFFRIEQVEDKKLMNMLLNKKFKPNYYHVSYVNARNQKGKRVADKITLLERPEPEMHKGVIASYIGKYELGYVKEREKSYSFKLDTVIDPFLRVLLENKNPSNVKVSFYIDVLGTKEIAAYVAMEKKFSDEEALFLVQKNVIKEEELIKWNNYKKYGPFYEEEPQDEEEIVPLVEYEELEKY